MKNGITIVLFALVLAAAGTPAVAEDIQEHEGTVTVSTPKGSRDLGGKSDHESSHEGLHRAADRSPAVEHHHEHEASSET